VTIHCISHRIELAIKDSLLNTKVNKTASEIRDFLITLFYLFKKSPKISRHLKCTGDALEAQTFKFKKVHGTRFVNHLRLGLQSALNNWVLLIQAIEHGLVTTKMSAKLPGILKKLKDTSVLAGCCFLLQLLDVISPLSLSFERGDIVSHEIDFLVSRTLSKIEDMEQDYDDAALDDVLAYANFKLEGTVLKQTVSRKGDYRRKKSERRVVEVQCEGMKFIERAKEVAPRLCQKVLPTIRDRMKIRFETFKEEVFANMKWIDPSLWCDNPKEEVPQLLALANLLEQRPADHYSISTTVLGREWRDFRLMCSKLYQNFNMLSLWKKVFSYRANQFPNVCKLAEFVLCIGPSNSAVESGFSHLTAMLNDRRLSLSHKTMENLLLLKINNVILTKQEKEMLLQKALDVFLQPGQKRKLTMEPSISAKRMRSDEGEEEEDDEHLEYEEEEALAIQDSDAEEETLTEDEFSEVSDCDEHESDDLALD
jgi:hypothetical protein